MSGVTCLPSDVLLEKRIGRWHGIREMNETKHVVEVVSSVLKNLCVDEDEVGLKMSKGAFTRFCWGSVTQTLLSCFF